MNAKSVGLADLERNPIGQNTGIWPSVAVWRLEEDAELSNSIPQDSETLSQIDSKDYANGTASPGPSSTAGLAIFAIYALQSIISPWE